MRLITREEEKIEFSLEQINNCTYNHALLCKIIGSVQNTFKQKTLTFLVCGDGGLAISCNQALSYNDLLLNYNDMLCKLLLGGLDVEAISQKDITRGSFHGEKMVWPVDFGYSYNSYMHAMIRMKLCNNVDAIKLLGASSSAISIEQLKAYLIKGESISAKIDNLSTYYLLNGITELKYGNWSAALSDLWIVTEQIIDYLWVNFFVSDPDRDPEIPSRKQTLINDNRTYSTSVKQEMLYQIGILTKNTFSNLYTVRKARNKLVHEGKMVSEEIAKILYESIDELFRAIIGDSSMRILPQLFS
jgi:hypothetical protein